MKFFARQKRRLDLPMRQNSQGKKGGRRLAGAGWRADWVRLPADRDSHFRSVGPETLREPARSLKF